MRVLMVGVDEQTKGGMWTVSENYLCSEEFVQRTNLKYIPTAVTGSVFRRLLFTAKALCLIFKELSSRKYDIVHIHMAERGSVYRKNLVMCIAKFARCRIVLHMHGAEFEQWYNSLSISRKKYVEKIVNKADKVIILGKYWENFMLSLIHTETKVSVVHNAVPVPDNNRYNPDAKNMLFLGVVGKRKGIYDLLEAVKQLGSHLPENVKLHIYGPDYENQIEATIEQMGLSEIVKYKGWLSGQDREKVFDETAINILPSYNEGLPMTILECMAHGIPNITTNVAAIPEVVNDSNGVVVTPGDVDQLRQAIELLSKNDKERLQRSEGAYKCASSFFSITAHVEKIMDIYRELIES